MPARVVLLTLLLFGFPGALAAQGLQGLVDRCSQEAGGFSGRCHVAGLALDALKGGVATAGALGSEIPGSASTLGYRLPSSPRLALSARTGYTRFSIPDVLRGYDVGGGDRDISVPTLQLSGVMGVLPGFSPLPTVGGVLSLDVTASAQRLFLSGNDGFDGGLWGWGLGLRLGLLRESFTFPGVSLSVARRWVDAGALGAADGDTPARVDFENRVTSVRAVAGKDLFGLGFFGGMGWDRISGESSVMVRLSPGGPQASARAGNLTSERLTYFGGVSRTFLIVQLSAEAGFSESLDPELPVDPGGNDYPSARAIYGSLGFRITF